MTSIVCRTHPVSNRAVDANRQLPMAKWPIDDLPLGKIVNEGPTSLSDAELLALVLVTGCSNRNALSLAREILAKSSYNLQELGQLNISQLKTIPGIGVVKAASIVAVMELSRRKQAGFILPGKIIRNSLDAALYFKPMLGDQIFESFYALYLNHSCRVIKCSCVGKGGITSVTADAKIILREALEVSATQILVCHNHPSGNLTPSSSDKFLTDKLNKAAAEMDILLLDHIIVSKVGFYSILSEQLLNFN